MNQDIIPPNQPRGSIRPPQRPDSIVQRPVMARRPAGSVVSMDGVKLAPTAHKSLLTMEPSKPVQPPQQLQTVRPVGGLVIQPAATPVSSPVVQPIPTPKADINQVENTPLEATVQSAATVTPPKKPKRHIDFKKHGLIALASLILLVTGYVSADTWLTNRKTEAVEPSSSQVAKVEEGDIKTAEGKDETPVSTNTLSNYVVSPQLPRAIYINKLNVAARVLPMSVNTDGSVQSPVNIFDAGWYTGSVKPGEIGATFIDGHASGATKQGLFGKLDTLTVGDTLEVEKGDNTKLTYRVVHTETVPLEGLDMKKVLLPYGNSLKALNIMTCTGEWIEDKQTFDHRVIVYTELVK